MLFAFIMQNATRRWRSGVLLMRADYSTKPILIMLAFLAVASTSANTS